MTRYIIRDSGGSGKYDNNIPYWNELIKCMYSKLQNKLIKALLNYRDEIDYSSLLVFIDTTKRKHNFEIKSEYNYKSNNKYYTLTQPCRYNSTITSVNSVIALLFNKYNECKIVDFSSFELCYIKDIMNYCTSSYYDKYDVMVYMFNLGAFTFMIDYNYSPNDRTPHCYYNNGKLIYYPSTDVCNGFPEELNLFVSKTQPRLSRARLSLLSNIHNPYYKAVREYLENNINSIKADIGIPVSFPPNTINITYVSQKECNVRSKERRRTELLAELKKLNEEMK